MAGPRRWPRRWGGLSSERCAVGWMSSYVERVPAAHMPLKPRLSRLDIELTERCNNDCIHCCINLPASDRHARSREMTTARVCDVIGEAAELGCLQVRLTGGEPLLRPDFEEIYLFARKLGLKVLIFTNARLISRHLADLLRDVPPLADIEVTVYGMHARSYDAVTRVPGSFAQFRRGVRRLLERRIRLVVKGALLPPNRGELAEFDQWAQSVLGMREAPGHSMFYDLRHRRDDPEKNLLLVAPLAARGGLGRIGSRWSEVPGGGRGVRGQIHGAVRRPSVLLRCGADDLRRRVRSGSAVPRRARYASYRGPQG